MATSLGGSRDAADPRDEASFTPFVLSSAQDLAEASGTPEVDTVLPIALPLMTLAAVFFFPSALSGIGFMAVRALGSSVEVSSAGATAIVCVEGPPRLGGSSLPR